MSKKGTEILKTARKQKHKHMNAEYVRRI